MKTILFALGSLCLGYAAALSTSVTESNNSIAQPRAAETCGDPSLATTYYKGFHAALKVHTFNTQAAFVNSMTVGGGWQSTIPSFRAWPSAGQTGTVPLYFTVTTISDDVTFSLTSSPTASIIGYVYPTQICNSIPLYGAAHVSSADHWYTTILTEHNELVALGWVDIGIVAYVLPIDTDCTCSS